MTGEVWKLCRSCGVKRPLVDFGPHSKGVHGRQSRCRSCRAASERERYERDRVEILRRQRSSERRRRYTTDYKRRRKYGIDSAEVDRLLTLQDGRCAICAEVIDPPCVDHCHTTGAIRGLLCSPCNLGLGSFRDDPDRLTAAANYLRRSAVISDH